MTSFCCINNKNLFFSSSSKLKQNFLSYLEKLIKYSAGIVLSNPFVGPLPRIYF